MIRLGSLETRRDFTFVNDTVNGFLQAADAPDVLGQEINLGTGQDVGIGELAEMVIGLTGRSVTIESDEQRLRPQKSEVMRLLSDNSLARECLDWQPEFSLQDGLMQTIQWIEQHLDFYRVGRYEI